MQLQEIKSNLSITTVLAHYHLKLDRNNRVCCPWHDDKTPSLQVYPKTNTWTCFSSKCDAGSGDTIDMIQRMAKCSKHEAILAAKRLLGTVTESQSLSQIFARMESALYRSQRARAYLNDRGLSNHLGIGYNPGTLYKGLRQCVIFALRDEADRVVSFYGRAIDERYGKHYYSKDRKGLYPGYPKTDTKRLVLTESVIDAATLVQATEEKVLALYGTNGLGEEHLVALDRLDQLEELILFFDGDEAGQMAVAKWSEVLHHRYAGIRISQVNVPEGEDVNSLLQGHEPTILAHLIKERTILFSPSFSWTGSIESASTEEIKSNPPSTSFNLDTSHPELISWEKENLRFTILGGIPLYPLDRLRLTIKLERIDSQSPLHRLRQQLDLYQDDGVEKLARKAAGRLELGSTLLHTALLELTDKIEAYRSEKLVAEKQATKTERWQLTEARRQRAIQFLQSDNLLKRTNEQIATTGVVGERINRLLLWLVFSSRLRDRPLHVIALGASGTGKTYLQDKIADLIPEDHKLEVTALSENALYYFERSELKHKLVLIEDLDGAAEDKILYAIRELQSKRKISKTIPLKDNKGNLRTITLCVEGPICLAGTTTRERLYEDNANRSLLVYLDSSAAQREAIMAYQRKLSAGKVNEKQESTARELLRDVQSVLKNIRVVNPYAEALVLPPEVFKPLRSNAHYLAFIETVTFYHQYQREVKRDTNGQAYIETSLEDIAAANKLLSQVLLAKSDELSKATRRFLDLLKLYLDREGKSSFYSGEVRKAYRMAPTTVKRHLRLLQSYGYVKIVAGSAARGYEYELMGEEEELSNKIETALDTALRKIKEKASGPLVGQKENGPLEGLKIN